MNGIRFTRKWLLVTLCCLLGALLVVTLLWLRPPPGHSTEASTYAGSAACGACHPAAYRNWTSSVHARAERPVSENLDRMAFDPPQNIVHGNATSSVRLRDGKFQLVTTGTGGKTEVLEPVRVIGETPLRQFLIPRRGGQIQVTALAFDPTHNEWFDVFGHENRLPTDWGFWANRGMNWNSMCAACHNTGLRKNYDAPTDSYSTHLEEPGVGCEACHGPGREHVRRQQEYPGQKPDPTLPKLKPKQWIDACGSCHARRLELTGQFMAGDLFLDHYLPEIPGESEVYYPDGQVREENYEYVSFLLSRMYRENVHCMDCHEPHTAQPKAEGNALCLKCHKDKIDPASHSHHDLEGAGSQCTACHMPVTVYMQRQPRHDHGFTIPDPHLTLEAQVPNACNRCHTDRSARWAAQATERWYGSPSRGPAARRARLVWRARRHDFTVIPDLLKLARQDPSPAWRAVAAGLLAQWVSEASVKTTLIDLVGDADPLVRSFAAGALETADPETQRAVTSLLEDPVRAVRIRSAWLSRASLPAENAALRELEESLILAQDQPPGTLLLGTFYGDRGQPEKAIEIFRRGTTWDPNAELLWEQLAVTLSAAGRQAEAVDILKKACRQLPAAARLRYLLGLGYAELGDLEEAVRVLKETCSLQPDLSRAWYNLGLALDQQGRSAEGIEALERAAKLEPSNAEYPYALATIYWNLGRFRQAEQMARRALNIDPKTGDVSPVPRFSDQKRNR